MLGEIIDIDANSGTITVRDSGGKPLKLKFDSPSASTRAAVVALGKDGAQRIVNSLVERQRGELEKAARGEEHLVDVESLALRLLIKEVHGI